MNLQENPAVSIVIQTNEGYAQLDGLALELNGDDAKLARSLIIEKKETTSSYDEDTRCRYFSIKPTWIRLMTKSSYPAEYELLLS